MKFNTQSYGKPNFRREMSRMSYPMKVECVIDMQERVSPIRAGRGEIVSPWRRDVSESDNDEQATFCAHLRGIVSHDVFAECEKAMIAFRELCEPQVYNVQVEECTHAN